MNLLLFFLILQSLLWELDACPTSCSCSYDGNGLAELRFKHFSFCLYEIVYTLMITTGLDFEHSTKVWGVLYFGKIVVLCLYYMKVQTIVTDNRSLG